MTRRQRLTLLAAILGSGVVAIDASIVNVALPAIERDLGGGLLAQQWVSNAYLLTLAALILMGHPTTNDDPQPLDAPRFVGALATMAMFVLTFVAEPLKFIGDMP